MMRRLAIVLLVGCCACGGNPEPPPGSISSEAAQKLVLERDEARDALAEMERRTVAEIEALRSEIRELRSSAGSDAIAAEGPATEPVAEAVDPSALAVELINMSARPIETNDMWTRFSWQGVVHNNLDRPIKVNAVVLFLDTAGFELERIDNKLTLQPGEFRKISGVEMVDDQVAPRVATVGGRVEQ